MSLRLRTLLGLSAVVVGCSSGGTDGSPGTPVQSTAAYTVSYRNPIRLPPEGRPLTAVGYATQVRTRDPIGGVRCGSDETESYKDVATYLGGIAWSHPVNAVIDQSFPPLHYGRRPPASGRKSGSDGASANAEAGGAPTIERPDLVGVKDGIAVFLSKAHGLMAVDTRSGSPVLSCSMKLPGEPKNFLFKGNEIAIIVNGRNGHNRSALLRYRIDGAGFSFVDAVKLDDQTIVDARLFDSTIVLYTNWSKPVNQPVAPTDVPVDPLPVPSADSSSSGRGSGGVASSEAARPGGYGGQNLLGTKLLVIQWDDALKVDYEDSLLSDPEEQDPFAGRTPEQNYQPGQIISERKTFTSFVSASDRYIVVPRNVITTKFREYQTTSYQVCTNYNPQAYKVRSCSTTYEQRPNPDYRPPAPATGDYSCNGKKLADCIKVAAPTVSRYINVPTGVTCNDYWQGRCEAYETRTSTYPTFDQVEEAAFTIYRFENGTFTKLDSTLAKLVEKNDAIAFETTPLSLPGRITNKGQIQFQNGQLYFFGDGALQTLAVEGNSIAYLDRLRLNNGTDNAAIVFSADRAMISAGGYYRGNGMNGSRVTMVNLQDPTKPALQNEFSMPGQTTQLILATGGILGPGQVSFTSGEVHRSLQKITLFNESSGAELDNLLLGTEYDAFASSYLDASDDQKIRLGSDGKRVFLPYSGRHHADELEPTAYRLNITRIENQRLVSERSFNVSDNIIRTAPLDENKSLVFGDSATYLVDKTQGDWALSTLRELYVPFATYRLDDANLFARVSRVGTKCKVTTHAGDARIFGAEEQLAEATVPCPESNSVQGFGGDLFFRQTKTGVRISRDGRAITALQVADVDTILAAITERNKQYCYIEGPGSGSSVYLLDAVPASILCEYRDDE